ncbi:tagatose 1,6-diphosphate aldolase GatY/KbaY [Paenibacillus sp. ov031]|uniref:class II fructose-1,6-bisphosphate aldolase n=1 Tax=unclassified Paenibacillus TaxID=185978 RepID=UPI0008921358|nr:MULTISPECIES: class II fructose-1,6-bisphosphate aldolase [unclassified Paenibacillus]SDK19947.1 tagatose 1,6-diphosphate aldolase GatY/KbaY [Paenibacillus sp. OK060]SEA54110.1 tagatose 1,6-diphosphate aldolase GatY/KbaY [Paenibacillus sp. 276b]SHN57924.1 tagatose 1,6-diphosphate aldolase GatY/KbaY [Paenibacillus sp. ov031]
MPLISSTEMLQTARRDQYAIAAFNVHTLEMLQAVVEAAVETESPLIIQTTVGTVNHLGPDYIAHAAKTAADLTDIPIALHLDHCTDFSTIIRCIRAGYTSVMIDASMYPFEENVNLTRKVMEVAQASGVNVEAELGKVGGVEDDIVVEEQHASLADPEDCVQFVERTGVTTLAPAIGTAHGIYKGQPNIDFERIETIANRVSVPLVLHGGSGIPAEQIHRAVALGMSKVNIATELRIAFSEAIKDVFLIHPEENDPRKYMAPAKGAVKRLAMEKIRLCGSTGKAGVVR